MATEVMMNAADALTPFLSCFREVQRCILRAVGEATSFDELDAIELDFGGLFLRIKVDPEDDTVELSTRYERMTPSEDASSSLPWISQIGKPFGWAWVSFNQGGYLDSVSLGFDEAVPQITISAIGSALRITMNRRVLYRGDSPMRHEAGQHASEDRPAMPHRQESGHP
jgi:hypothetical protein